MDAHLLDPISDHDPCGSDMSFSAEFDAIQEMRREDDPSLDQGEWVTTLKVADWRGVETACANLLKTRTKDLRLAMWWCDAAARNHGYTGLADGLELSAQLCERYWDSMHPEGEDGDWDQRIGNLAWLLQRVVVLSRELPVTKGATGSFSLRDLEAARALQTQIDKHPHEAEQLSEGRVTLDAFARAQRETPKAWLLETLAAANRGMEALQELQRVTDARLTDEGPSFVPARDALASARDDLQRLAREAGAIEGSAGSQNDGAPPAGSTGIEVTDAAGAPAPGTGGQATAGGPLRSRAQALQQLREVADYFRRTEPHSPVAYLADKAARWGEMPLHVWLRTVLKDPGALTQVEELLGLNAPQDGS
ncbi:type VI secretion system protein TssA [Caldimonas brevitalea]|uniref:Type VI secretion system protein ImpA n=1 Tax=Caldimonas brevitalea TaxID=413882 RepID=A0A0G3BKM1_9BURK|nr:type VI secretion system protein TssA [Caldimonas brevitalea]AKJ28538.1 type VI secretion system protein ImpA [Caldimonas brevitalea]